MLEVPLIPDNKYFLLTPFPVVFSHLIKVIFHLCCYRDVAIKILKIPPQMW